ncbi:hypothetical protein MKX03_032989 [Papaver bracteatum]|nr:hypothetical protein MKX03_032989 [Papaver bracteatum]
MLSSLGVKSRSILSSAITIPQSTNGLLSTLEKNTLFRVSTRLSSSNSKTKDAEQLTRPAFDLGAEFTHPDKAVMEVLSDFVEKNRHLETYPARLRNLLTSAQMKELGVGYNEIPIPDKQEWKASWHEEGKPKWLGTIPTHADGRWHYTASITGYIENDGRKGGYGVILFDHYGRPKVASVGVSLKSNVPLIYYEFQGVRSALQLALDHGFGAEIKLYCNADTVRRIIDNCLGHTSWTPWCMGNIAPWNGSKLCTGCVGLRLFRCKSVKDFDLLFPVIEEILDLFHKINNFTDVNVRICYGSGHLAKIFSTSTNEKEMNRFGLLVDKLELYEMVLQPDKFPEEVDNSIYDEVFRGDRVHSELIMVEKLSKTSEHTHPDPLYSKLRKYWSHKMRSDVEDVRVHEP